MAQKTVKKRQRINQLNTIAGLVAQMRSVYRAARVNCHDKDIDPQTAKILVEILRIITVAHRDSELEIRVSELEKQLGKSNASKPAR